jgi:type III secretion protein R
VLTALAAVLSLFVMAPVGDEMLSAIQSAEVGPVKEDPWGIESARSLCSAAAPPLMAFLKANTPPSEVDFFLSLAGELPGSEAGFRVLLPAFATGEIVDAFVIGFLIYLPFLVIDLIVSTVLLTLGMHMLSPTGISLPLKLLLFIIVDGWHVLLSGIVVNYA